jgi:hypothetical protein
MREEFELESATQLAVIAAWLAGAVIGAYLSGWWCAVREGLVDWLQRTHPAALPRWRVEQPDARANSALVDAAHGRGEAQ